MACGLALLMTLLMSSLVSADEAREVQALAVQLVGADAALSERVHGQLSDLAITLSDATDTTREPTVCVTFSAIEPLGWSIQIDDRSSGQQQTRQVIGDPTQTLARSAVDEAAALVVRVAVRSILQGAPLADAPAADVPVADAPVADVAVAGAPVADAPSAELPVADAAEASEANSADMGSLQPWLGIGTSLALADFDSQVTGVLGAVQGHVGLRLGTISIALAGSYSIARARADDAIATATIDRHALQILARRNVIDMAHGHIALQAALGVHVFERRTTAVANGWQGTTDQRLLSPSASIAMQWRVRLFQPVHLMLSVGVDVLSRVPQLSRQAVTTSRSLVARLSWWMPIAGLGIEWSP